MNLLEYAIIIESALVITYGMIKGGIEVRRFIAVGVALILAYTLPTILGLAPPGSPTYLVLYHDVEGMIRDWGLTFKATAYAGLAWAVGMTILNIIASISTLGIGILPLQEFTVIENMGFIIDPIADVIFAVMHVAQVMTAVLHTIAYLAWFSYAVAPAVIGIAVVLMTLDRTRPAGVALFILTLAIMFITTMAAHTLNLVTKEELLNETVTLMQWLSQNAPNATIRGFLVLNASYPYLVSGVLYGINYTVIGKSVVPIEHPIANFTAFTGSVTPINIFGAPQISNATFLWLSINPNYGCLLLTYINNQSVTEPCDSPEYLSSNATYAEVIEFGNPPFSVITATLNGTTVYTGAWKWLSSPTQSSVETGNNTVTINFTISVPPEKCVNITNPRTGLIETICYPSTATATLWYFASNAVIQLPSKVGNITKCQYQVVNTTLYREVNINNEENELKALINKLNEEITIGREITGMGKNLTLTLPNPTPTGYEQREIEITCTNYANKTVVVPGSITITGNIGNPWYAKDPLGLTPSVAWVINSIVVGSEKLLSGWSYFRKLFFAVGGFVPKWLAESVAIFGLLDGAMWIAGFPTPLAPAWAVMNSVIHDLSLVLYLRIDCVSRLLNKVSRRVRRAVSSRASNWLARHRRVARLINPVIKAHHDVVITARRIARHPVVSRVMRYVRSPIQSALEDVENKLSSKAEDYMKQHNPRLARLARAGALMTKMAREYPRASELGMRGRLHEVTGMRVLSNEGLRELKKAIRNRDIRGVIRALGMTSDIDRRLLEHPSTRAAEESSGRPTSYLRKGDVRRLSSREVAEQIEDTAALLAFLGSAALADQRIAGVIDGLIIKVRENPNPVDTARLIAAILGQDFREIYKEAMESLKPIKEAAKTVQPMYRGDWGALAVLASAMNIEYTKAKEVLDNAWSKHTKEALPKYMSDREVIEKARMDIKPVTETLHAMKEGVIMSHDALKPLLNYFIDNNKAIEIINNWWVWYFDTINRAIKEGASSEEITLISKKAVKELTTALVPFIIAKYKEALGQRALQAASRDPDVIRRTVIDTLRELGYPEWVKEQAEPYKKYLRFKDEYATLLTEGARAMESRKTFAEIFPKLADVTRNDLFADRAIALHLAVTEMSDFTEKAIIKETEGESKPPRLTSPDETIKAIIDLALTRRETPLATVLSVIAELGVDLNKAIPWADVEKDYMSNRMDPTQAKQLFRDLRQLWDGGYIDINRVEKVAPGVGTRAIHAKDREETFNELFKDVRKAVFTSEEARLARPGELISVWMIDIEKLADLTTKYLPKEALKVLRGIGERINNELDSMLELIKHDLDIAYEPLINELRMKRNELERAVQAGDYKAVQQLSREVLALESKLETYNKLTDLINKALNALASDDVNTAIRALHRTSKEIRKLIGESGHALRMKFGGEEIQLERLRDELLRATNLMDALTLTMKVTDSAEWMHQASTMQRNQQPNPPTHQP